MKKLIIINEDKTISVVDPTGEIEIDVLADQLNAIVYEKDLPNTPFLKWENNSIVEDTERKQQYELKLTKTNKAKELNQLVIAMNKVDYDANQEAIGNMAAVVAVATATFQRAISIGVIKAGETEPTVMTPAEAYKYVYKDQTVTWKGADNKPHTVQLESLVEASEKAMAAKAAILFKY